MTTTTIGDDIVKLTSNDSEPLERSESIPGADENATDISVAVAQPRNGTFGSFSEAVDLGRRIGASWQKTTTAILATAALCADAQGRHSTQLPLVLRHAAMSKATFCKLARIGHDQRLAKIQALLPPNFSIIYAISRLNDDLLGEAIAANLIHPDLRRVEIEALRERPNTTSLPGKPAGRRFEVRVPEDLPERDFDRLKKVLEQLRSDFAVDINQLG